MPTITDFSISRIRQADRSDLPTTGHLISHNTEELRETLNDTDTSNALVLDDTSFSGTTSAIVEQLFRRALPERTMQFTHGFLILNRGILGESLGAKQRLEQLGSMAVGGMCMHTPRDDGWHFFDMVEQANFDSHIDTTMEILLDPDQPITAECLNSLFPNMLTHDQLLSAQRAGRFVTNKQINGELHVRNPQLLPNIIAQGHLLKPQDWRNDIPATLEQLKTMNKLLKGENNA